MKQVNLLLMSAAMTLASCGGGTKDAEQQDTAALINRSDIKIEGKRMTPEALWAMGRIGNVTVSPDEKQIAYSVAYYSVPENKSNNEIFVMNADGGSNRQITRNVWQESQPVWIKDGKKIAFLCNESGSSQIWEMNSDGTERRQLTQYDNDIEGFSFSPDGKKILFITQVKTVKSTADKYPDLPKATGILVTDLMYKHWDEWVTTAPHPFIADFDGNAISNVQDILDDEPYESPMKPWGGIEQLAWSPSSDKVAYTCRKKTGLAYAVSTNSDIYIYDLATKQTKNITEENKGYDINPQYSPDGKYIAWQSMERDGYEADLNRLFIMNLETGEKRFVSKAFESNVDAFLWNKDSGSIYFIGVWHGETQIYNINLADSDRLTQLTDGMYDYASLALCGDKVIAKRHSMSMGDEIYAVNNARSGDTFAEAKQLTFENKHIYDQLEMGKVEAHWMKTTDGKQMLTWVIYPPKFDPNKKYPTLLFCEGGPQSPVSQFWSYRWNFQIMAANDYIIVAPNRRGLPGFGVEWNEAISGDYGGQCMKDYFTAIDEISKEPYVDKERLGCVGASFGGFSVYWLAGHHNKRFKAFIAHDGIFNMEMQYLETEEKWFANWDMGGAYWEKNNITAQRTFTNSPHKFVDKWDTPILCIHGEKDFRILANQAMAAFDAAVMRGVPAELLIYPDENHWVLKPQNGILWQRTFFEWLDKWLKPTQAKTAGDREQ
ncbi:prolyl oligopeptidase family serine peptidase [Bacteroides helcogenes]|uniref:Dipeptidyl-peptidase 5 n=1 Tax=Bacteroides helcogenes (strain ATCC 35417 / DSM 20613 / JCM 6297 / CCUG 15421 / P 36-108) TaxID=693979 RepID=E6SVA5_BACT6|nr:prolyl oligopeptidase family serine peptidase [Bacteroides helcogenes]ADV44471.1 WD40-like beta Propeller containing protein [Bacteroides helcogenes P 36-108]MDY5237121.1 S9 family peptidase [Bacteroides helcogenes]